jgi:integrase/recombinase XerD
MQPRFEQFIREKQYVTNVSQRTLEWYRQAFRWLPSEHPSQQDVQETVLRMHECGLKATAVNSYITGLNSYLHWDSGAQHVCGAVGVAERCFSTAGKRWQGVESTGSSRDMLTSF